VLRLGVPTDHPLAEEGETVLRQWLAQVQLRLELVPLEPGAPGHGLGLHGHLEKGCRLQLVSGTLAGDLQALPGAAAWQRWGGTIGQGEQNR
jgi:hypothetical protein